MSTCSRNTSRHERLEGFHMCRGTRTELDQRSDQTMLFLSQWKTAIYLYFFCLMVVFLCFVISHGALIAHISKAKSIRLGEGCEGTRLLSCAESVSKHAHNKI